MKISHEKYSNIICETCDTELKNVQAWRRELIHKQEKLTKFVEKGAGMNIKIEPSEEKHNENSGTETEEDELSEDEELSKMDFNEDDGEEERYIKYNVTKCMIFHFYWMFHLLITFYLILDFCDICGKKTLLKSMLVIHMKSHLPPPAPSTPLKVMKDIKKLMNRMKTVDPNVQYKGTKKTFVCPCGEEFRLHSQLVDHTKKVHQNIRDHICHDCGKSFFSKRELDLHIKRVHMKGLGEGVFCEICGNQYSSKSSLRAHRKYHQEPQYVCAFPGCDKKFVKKQKLDMHEVSKKYFNLLLKLINIYF